MNLAESMVLVFKSKSQNIFSGFFKNDLKIILKDFKRDFITLAKSSHERMAALPARGFKNSFTDFKNAAVESSNVFRVMPRRVLNGFKIFREDFLEELEVFPDQKQKTVFCMKVIGALSSFALGSIPGLQRGNKGFGRHSVAAFLKAEIVIRLSQLFILRILNEVEKNVTDTNDLKNINYFRTVLTDANRDDQSTLKDLTNQDESIKIVEKLKNYILTGYEIGI